MVNFIKTRDISKYCIIVIIGNKADNKQNRVYSYIKGKEYSNLNDLQFYEILLWKIFLLLMI